MYSMIRIMIGLIVFLVLKKLLKTLRMHLKYIISGIIATVVTIVLIFLPFENLFFSFSSPEKAFDYFVFDKKGSYHVIEGQNSDFVIGYNDNAETILIVPKNSSGWKVGIGIHTKNITRKLSGNTIIHVYRHSFSEDCFVEIYDIDGRPLVVSDNSNSEFIPIQKNITTGKRIIYYAYVCNFEDEYSISVNGKTVTINQDKT